MLPASGGRQLRSFQYPFAPLLRAFRKRGSDECADSEQRRDGRPGVGEGDFELRHMDDHSTGRTATTNHAHIELRRLHTRQKVAHMVR